MPEFDFGVSTEEEPKPVGMETIQTRNGQTLFNRGEFVSPNYKKNEAGWMINEFGDAEFNSGLFRGTFSIGGTTITIDNSEDIQENLDEIDEAGGGTLFLQNGTYVLTSDILVPSGVRLEGVSRDGVILDCNTNYSVKITGSDVYSTGTVTINNGDTTVVGSGTTFTSAMVGRYIFLDGLWYEITAFVSTTNLTITQYQGDNLAGSAFVLATINTAATITKVTIMNATASGGVEVSYAMEPKLLDIIIFDCGTGIDMDYVVFPQMILTSNENGINLDMNFVNGFAIDFSEFNFSTTGVGIVMVDSGNATFFNSSVNDNATNGISITRGTKMAFISMDISGNTTNGIEFVSGNNDNQFSGIVFDGNGGDGIKLTATSDRNTITSVSAINNGGYGINIAASTCDNNIIDSNAYENNTSSAIQDLGTGTIIN